MFNRSLAAHHMMFMRMMKLAKISQRNVLRTNWPLPDIPKNVSSISKRFIHKVDWRVEKVCCSNGYLVSVCLSQLLPKPPPLPFSEYNDHKSCIEHKVKYKRQENGGGRNKGLFVPLFALVLFQGKKNKEQEEIEKRDKKDKEEEEEEKRESQLITMIKLGILALQRGQLNKAEQLLHVALKAAQEAQNTQAVTYIFDLLANLAYQREEYTKAEKLFKDVLQRMFSDGMPEDDNAVVEISLKLASVYASRGDYEKAVEGFHFCLGTQEEKIKKHGENNVDEDTLLLWSMSMDWYARFLLNLQKYDLAKKHFIKAYEMSERVQGLGHPQTAVLLNDIGSVCSLQKNYTEAISYLEKAIDAARESQSQDIGSFYVNLGAVYLQQGMLLEAERFCKEGLLLARKMKNNEAVDEAKNCLQEIYLIKGEKSKPVVDA